VHTYETCAESPYHGERDERKHVGPRVWDNSQTLILNFTKETMWSKFNDLHSDLFSTTKYNEILSEEVWNFDTEDTDADEDVFNDN
jgi:hypothetical protein